MHHFSVQSVLVFVLTCSLQPCFHSHSLPGFPCHLFPSYCYGLLMTYIISLVSSESHLHVLKKLCLRIFLLFLPLFFWTPDLWKTADILKKESQLCFCAQMLIMGTVSGFLFACFFPTLFNFFFCNY